MAVVATQVVMGAINGEVGRCVVIKQPYIPGVGVVAALAIRTEPCFVDVIARMALVAV